jgi:F-type H+-transporting ATPase subunit alpha
VLKQKRSAPVDVGCQVAIVYAVINGWLNDVEPAKVADYETGLFEYLEARYGELLDRIGKGYWEDSDIETMKEALKGYNKR